MPVAVDAETTAPAAVARLGRDRLTVVAAADNWRPTYKDNIAVGQ